MKKLYSFNWDCGRMGWLAGLFVAEESDVEGAIGKEVYFGEVLGKHSEIYGTLEEKDLAVVSEDQEKIEWLVSLLGNTAYGHNPLEYLTDEAVDEWNEQQEWMKHRDESYIEDFE